jgi:hypothetical protein
MWQADTNSFNVNGDKTVPVPLKRYQWNWNAVATNSGSAWGVQSSTNYATAPNAEATNEPTWSPNEYYNRQNY